MITQSERGLQRVTLTLDAVDVDLLDRLAALEGTNRSNQMRQVLGQLRPTLRATIEAFEAANRSRDAFLAEAARLGQDELQAIGPELDRLQQAFLGAMSRIEGAAAAGESRGA